jgi:hypothetical protein
MNHWKLYADFELETLDYGEFDSLLAAINRFNALTAYAEANEAQIIEAMDAGSEWPYDKAWPEGGYPVIVGPDGTTFIEEGNDIWQQQDDTFIIQEVRKVTP